MPHAETRMTRVGRTKASAWLPPSPVMVIAPSDRRHEGRHLLFLDSDSRRRRTSCDALRAAGLRVTAPHAETAVQPLLRGLEFDAVVIQAARGDVPWSPQSDFGSTSARLTPILALGTSVQSGFTPDVRIQRLPNLTQLRGVVGRFMDRANLKPHSPARVRFGCAVFDLSDLRLTVRGVDALLSRTEALLLRSLALNAYTPMPRTRLRPDQPDSRGVDVAIHRLRRRLGDDPVNPKYLRTVRGKGYLLLPEAIHDLQPTPR